MGEAQSWGGIAPPFFKNQKRVRIMKIKKVKATNVKGRDIDLELSQFNLITGQNGSGKTGILDAIKVGCLGHHPVFGKRNRDTFQICSGDEMKIRVESDGGDVNTVLLSKNGKGVVSGKTSMGFQVDPMAVDASEFIGMSPKAMMNFVFARSGIEIDSDEAAMSMSIDSEDQFEIDTCKELQQITRQTYYDEDKSPVEATEEVDAYLTERVKEEKRTVQTLKKTVDGLGSLSDEPPMNPSEKLEGIKNRLTELRNLDAKLNAKIEDLGRKVDKMNDLSDHVFHLRESSGNEEEYGAILQSLEMKQEEMKGKIEAEASMRQKASLMKMAEGKIVALSEDLEKAEESIANLKIELANLEKGTCHACGQKIPHNPEKVLAISNSIRLRDQALKEIKLKIQEQEGLHTKIEDELEELDLKMRGSVRLQSEIDDLHRRKNQMEGASTARIEEKQKEIKALNEEIEAIPGLTQDCEVNRKAIYELQAEEHNLIQKVQEFKNWEAEHNASIKARKALEEAEKVLKVVDHAKKKFGLFKGRKVKEAFKSILEVANGLLFSVNEDLSLAYESELEVRTKGGGRYALQALCGAEQLVVMAGLTVGLAKNHGVLIMDEFSIFDDRTKGAIVSDLAQAIESGILEQVIIADCRPETGQLVNGVKGMVEVKEVIL